MMKQIVVVFIAVLSGACSSVDQFHPTMAADSAELGFEGLVYQNELAQAYQRTDNANQNSICGLLLPSYQEREKWSYRRYQVASKTKANNGNSTSDIFKCLTFRTVPNDDTGKAMVARHIQAGLALSKLYCENYFDRISLHVGKRNFFRTAINDAGAAMSAVLGLSGAGTAVTAGAGVAFGLADGTFANYNGQFVVGPDLAIMRNAVLAAQADKAKAIASAMPENYPDANAAIMDHAKVCSFLGMKGLVNDRVAVNITNSRDALVSYIAKFALTQEDITTKVQEEKQKRAKIDAEAKERDAKAAEEAAAAAAAAASEPSQSADDQSETNVLRRLA